MLGNKKKLTDMLKAPGLRTFARCVVVSLKYASIVELTAGGSFGRMKSSKEMLKPSSMVGGRFRYGVGGRHGRFNWENLPRKAIFRRYCEADIKGEDLA